MSGDEHVRALIARVEALTPHFGRARADLEAIASRARNRDYRGVLQNTRLVVETLFRAMIAKDKSQQPGKQTLEQLLSKLASELPTHVAVHARTIQACGNVGAHDQAAELFAPGVEVKPEEAVAALNALVPILEWYKAEHIGSGAAVPAATVPSTGKSGKLVVAGIVAAVLAGGSLVMITQAERATTVEDARGAIEAYYAAVKEPAPPESCRATHAAELAAIADSAAWLSGGKPNGKRAEDLQALDRMEKAKRASAEGAFFLARARLFAGAGPAGVIEAAEAAIGVCKDWAPALAVLGSAHLFAGSVDDAKKAYARAIELAPEMTHAKVNLAVAELQSGGAEQASRLLEEVLAKDPENASALMLAGMIARERGDPDAASEAFCKAKALGEERARELCP